MDGAFRGRYRVIDVSLLTIVAVIVVVLVLIDARSGGSGRGGLEASVTIGARVDGGRVVPAGFLGLSLEYAAVAAYAGDDPSALDPVFVQLIRNLSPGQAPVLRIGGASSDGAWSPAAGIARPAGVTFTLSQRFLALMRSLTASLNARLILGLNLEAGSPPLAAAEANALVGATGMTSVQALELGNEPDLYGHFAWYRTADGRPVTGRPASYDFSAFARDFTATGSGLPQLPLAGPAFGSFAWTDQLAGFLRAQPRLGLVTLHRYPLQSCFIRPGSSRYPTIPHLLSAEASTGLAHSLAPYAAIAHGHGAPLRVDELNTVSCGAALSTSNTFASALWALDALFELARAGVDGVNIHTFPGAGYELFRISRAAGRWRAAVAPEYYGLLMFAQATPPGSQLLGLSPRAGAQTKLWATRAPDGRIRVVLINKDTARAHVVAVRRPGSSAVAVLERLRAPSAAASTGVTLGGQSFGMATESGALQGPIETVTLRPSRGTYRVTLPSGSAALLTLPAPPR